jgi:pyruvate formate-lyase activating enzyme-like uncharacterized protein
MILDIQEATLASIRNPALRSHAEKYVEIQRDFIRQVCETGIEFAEVDDSEQVQERIAALGKRGAIVRNDGKSVYVNRISPGCVACQTAVGSHTFFVSLKCHRNCFFCFNPNQEEYGRYRDQLRDLPAELDALHDSGQRVQHLALTGGEPLLHKPETPQFFEHARRNFPKSYTRLYTCGDHLDRETLDALQDSGMNEIRFSIRIEDSENARRHTYSQIALAREYIPNVMVEMPVLPGSLEAMKDVLLELDRLSVFGINLLEFCFPYHNVEEYRARGYQIKARPFRVLYNYWYAGGLPVAGSETTCLDLIDFALESRLKLGVHYCSLENKHTGQVYQQDARRLHSGLLYFSQKDYFLKSAKIFGEDAAAVQQLFDRKGLHDYSMNDDGHELEFHVSKIRMLKDMDMEIGISTHILEEREGETVLRELKLDVTTPQAFRLSDV